MPQLTMDRNKHLRSYPAIHRQQFRPPGMARDMDMCLPVGSHVHMLGSQSILDFANGDLIAGDLRSEEHTSELQSLMRISYAVFCLQQKKRQQIEPCNHSN